MASTNSSTSLGARLGDAGPRLEAAQASFMTAFRAAEKAIKGNPIAAIAAGLGVGAILGWLIKRR